MHDVVSIYGHYVRTFGMSLPGNGFDDRRKKYTEYTAVVVPYPHTGVHRTRQAQQLSLESFILHSSELAKQTNQPTQRFC